MCGFYYLLLYLNMICSSSIRYSCFKVIDQNGAVFWLGGVAVVAQRDGKTDQTPSMARSEVSSAPLYSLVPS